MQGRSSLAQFGGMLIFDLQDDNRVTAIGHADCGIYAEVIAGGAVATGDDVTVSLSA